MERDLLQKMAEWKESRHRKPLLLWGARQTGKTWLMKEFGRQYFENTVYISFYNNRKMAGIFESDYDVRRIINAIEIEMHTSINTQETLLIFDEVQAAPKVVESLKYFCEDAGEYAVVAAGSLLGVAIHEGVSFPVGKVDELRLHPMSFREFLLACGEDRLAEYIQDYTRPEVSEFSDRYKDLLKSYYCVGGMPEAVSRFIEKRNVDDAREVQISILHQYEGDFGKHIKENELPRIRMVWNSLPIQLAKENKKFFFGQIRRGARQKDFELALQWLEDAGLIIRVNKVSKPAMPLKSYVDFSSFKIYMVDVGLLGALSELETSSVIHGDALFSEFKGALTEQYVVQETVAQGKYTPYYYSGEKSVYEVDLLIQKGRDVVPVEVKAEDNLRSKSLKFYCEKYKPKIAFRTSAAGYRDQEWMRNVPLWAIAGV